MQNRLKLAMVSITLLLFGCTSALLQTRQENQATEQRLIDKNRELQTLEDQNRYLKSENERLSVDLNQKSMTLNELNDRLAQLKAENAKIKATTLDEKKKKAKALQSLEGYSQKISALDSDKQLTQQQKKKKIEALKQEIRKYLVQ